MSTLIFFLQQTVLFSVPLIVAGLGGMFCERSGIINIGLEGEMIIGAFCGCIYLNLVPSSAESQLGIIIALLIAGLGGLIYAAIHAFAAVKLNANQAVSGIALNIAATALVIFLARIIFGRQQISFNNTYRIEEVPGLGKIPFIGDVFFQKVYIFLYIAIVIVIISAIVLNKTRFGMRLKACGEYPQAADSVGVNVGHIRFAGAMICGFLAGMAGIMLIIPSSTEFNASVSGYGFLAVSVLILGQWKPSKIVIAAVFFGMMKTFAAAYSGIPFLISLEINPYIYRMIPFVVTLIVLAFSSKKSQGPAAAGQPFDKGMR